MALAARSRLGPYEVVSPLGAGAMGEVYRARDPRLGREVAVKVISSDQAGQADRQRRFEQEARAVAALSHPNILAVYDVGSQGGTSYVVFELLDGQTLHQRLERGPVPVRKATEYGVQICQGLAAAHARGIVHRDLKPQNLFLTAGGQVKILDFGLAKLHEPSSPGSAAERSEAPTATEAGLVLGTAGYMSPEQARGRLADARSDIFALGAILYEMLSGRRAFEGESAADMISAILNRDPPDIEAASAEPVPPGLERVIRRCLEKDPDERFQTARDVTFALEALSGQGGGDVKAPVASPRGARRRAKLAAGALAAALGLGLLVLRTPPPVPRVTDHVQITSDRVEKYGPWFDAGPVTDGSRVYFNDFGNSGYSRIAYVAASGGEVVPFSVPFPYQPLVVDVSRDGADLLVVIFDAAWFQPGELWVVPAVGGTPRRVGDLRANYAVWSPAGTRIALTRGRDLLFAKADGSDLRKAWTAAGFVHSPAWSPDGRRVRLSVKEDSRLRRSAVWEVEVGGGEPRPLLPGFEVPACCGRWTADGAYFVFEAGYRRGDLWVLPESSRWPAQSRSQPVRLTEGAMQFFAPLPGRDGRRVFAVGWKPQGELVRYDAGSGHFVPYLSGISAQELDFSRDGQWIVFTTYPEASVWRSRVDGRDRLQLTFPPMTAGLPRFSPDGTQVVFTALGPERVPELRLVPAAGGPSTVLVPADRSLAEPSWSADGRTLAIGSGEEPQSDRPITIQLLELETGRLSTVPGSEGLNSPRWSPDGRFLAALSHDASRLMLHDFTSGQWRVLLSSHTNWWAWPTWSRDGRHLFVETGPTCLRVGITDGRRETVARFTGLQRAMSHFGTWAGVAPDGSVLALRNAGVNEIFALTWEVP